MEELFSSNGETNEIREEDEEEVEEKKRREL